MMSMQHAGKGQAVVTYSIMGRGTLEALLQHRERGAQGCPSSTMKQGQSNMPWQYREKGYSQRERESVTDLT